jgi:hypothetical protein
MTENDAVDPRGRALAFEPLRAADCHRPLPVEYLPIVGRIVGETVKLRDLSRGNGQAHEDEEDCKDSAHGALPRDHHVER